MYSSFKLGVTLASTTKREQSEPSKQETESRYASGKKPVKEAKSLKYMFQFVRVGSKSQGHMAKSRVAIISSN